MWGGPRPLLEQASSGLYMGVVGVQLFCNLTYRILIVLVLMIIILRFHLFEYSLPGIHTRTTPARRLLSSSISPTYSIPYGTIGVAVSLEREREADYGI